MNDKLPDHTKRGSFWWRDNLKLLDKYKGMALVTALNGSTCLLWEDCWQGPPWKLSFPELYSYAKKPNISLAAAVSVFPSSDLFSLPMSAEAFDQFQHVQNSLQNFQISADKDVWSYIWGGSLFSSRKAYRHLKGTSPTHPVFKWLWKSSYQHNHKVFFWLLAQDRLSTRTS